MAEWLYEAGIGEARAALVDDGAIVEAAIEIAGRALRVGAIVSGRLTARIGSAALIEAADGELLVDRVPASTSIGRSLHAEVTREAIPERGRPKRARGVVTEAPPRPAPTLRDRIADTGHPVRTLRPHDPDVLEDAGWSELLEEARTGEVGFGGGGLRIAITPAMAVIDIDGDLPPEALALAGADAAARAIRRLGIGGSIGIDFPTLGSKAARQAVAAAIDERLPQPFERTAVNGFGFLQIVRPRPRASLPELIAQDPIGAAARVALRTIERTPATAPNHHRLPAAVRARIAGTPAWWEEIVRRTGRMPILSE